MTLRSLIVGLLVEDLAVMLTWNRRGDDDYVAARHG